jgi:uncharacterized membrane protein YeaQ/YmgE (transglycosylase-associated protein family)
MCPGAISYKMNYTSSKEGDIPENTGYPCISNHQIRRVHMNIIIYLIAGAIVGYIASRIMRTNSQQGLILDIVVGVIGAFIAGWFLTPIFKVGTINDAITLPTMLVTLGGAIILLFVVNLLRRGRAR